MVSKYFIFFDKKILIPARNTWIKKAWGNLPYSYVQDDEDLNKATYLDLKINKWEVDRKWSTHQAEEPWIRIELLNGVDVSNCLSENGFNHEKTPGFLLFFELDGDGDEIDYDLLDSLVASLVNQQECNIYDELHNQIDKVVFIKKSLDNKKLKMKLENI